MQQERYEKPELDIARFRATDMITTSIEPDEYEIIVKP